MAHVEEHLQLSELEGRYRSASEATEARHFQVIWLLAKGHTVGEVSEMTSFGQRWLEQLLSRYNKLGPSSLGDRRRSNGSEATILKPEVLAVLKERLKKPPADGGLWSGPKVAAWMARSRSRRRRVISFAASSCGPESKSSARNSATQRPSALTLIPRSPAICRCLRPLVCKRRTASSLKARSNRRPHCCPVN